MKILNLIKYVLFILAIILAFINWKIAISLFIVSSILHVMPKGPNKLLNVIIGYLIIAGIVFLFSNLLLGIILIVSGFLLAKFKVWANKVNFDYYDRDKEIYQKARNFVIESFTKIGKTHQIKHFEQTVYWLKKLKPDADESLLISAIAHDIERGYRKADMDGKKLELSYTDKEFFRPHEERGADIIADFLEKENVDEKIIERVKMLVSRHEEGGNEDQNLLKDADSISFFENNVQTFLDKHVKAVGKEKVREKFDWMYNRITSDKAKSIAEKWYNNAIKELNK